MSFTTLSYGPLPLATPIMFVGEKDTHNEILKTRDDFSNTNNMDGYKLADTQLPSPVFNPQDLIGRSFLIDEQPDGQRARGKLYKLLKIMNHCLRTTQPGFNLGYL
jgi:hypothetical protein